MIMDFRTEKMAETPMATKVLSQLNLQAVDVGPNEGMRNVVATAAQRASRIEALSAGVASQLVARGVLQQNADAIASEFFRRLATMLFTVDLYGSVRQGGKSGASSLACLTWRGDVGAPFLGLLRLSMHELLAVCLNRPLDAVGEVLAPLPDDAEYEGCRARLVFLCSLLGRNLPEIYANQSLATLLRGLVYWANGSARVAAHENGWAAE